MLIEYHKLVTSNFVENKYLLEYEFLIHLKSCPAIIFFHLNVLHILKIIKDFGGKKERN